MKNWYLLVIFFLVTICLGAFLLQKREDSYNGDYHKTIAIDDIKNMFSTNNISIDPASVDVVGTQLEFNLSLSFSPILYRQMTDVEQFGLKVDLPNEVFQLSSLKNRSMLIPSEHIAYGSGHALEISFTVQMKKPIQNHQEFEKLFQNGIELGLTFTNAQNEAIASFDHIETSLVS
ncbi:hypothetical protein MFLO_09927 [Listeria floridensis FSL S10-1187]|uniref:DUF2140 domain-containing protein n=1 Tax=Listeria floridensis FSL S10-1187 TaxID=1265817 RepID=A0ABN0REB5_9LIST|nr:hypothetical protein [Listeria floridensis]EUJ31003.1 hypothetical protein MFLO_09927 [Listeria floridensis FSL S10-1187]